MGVQPASLFTNEETDGQRRPTVRGLQLRTLVEWALRCPSVEGLYGELGLPPVQRGLVWKPKQIVDLWDSIFRGFPVGSFYLVERHADDRPISDVRTKRALEPGWSLLDGQQRLHALMSGFGGPPKPPSNVQRGSMRCLWVDLEGDRDGMPRLHLTSNSQPFGYDPDTGQKLRSDQKSKPRLQIANEEKYRRIEGSGPIRDHELFEGLLSGKIEPIDMPQPPRPPRPPEPGLVKDIKNVFPLHELLGAWLKPEVSVATDGLTDEIRTTSLIEVVGQRDDVAIGRIVKAFKAFNEADVALIRVQLEPGDTDRGDMLRLFDRIGAGGTVPDQNERLYSVYKARVPQVHDAIEHIYETGCVGLPPVNIAGAIIRIANAGLGRTEDDRNYMPDVAAFTRLTSTTAITGDKTIKKDGAMMTELTKLMPVDHAADGLAARAFRKVYETLSKTRQQPDYLPSIMLASMPPHCVEVLVMAELRRSGIVSEQRSDAIVFALLWQLLVIDDNYAAAQGLQCIRTPCPPDGSGTFQTSATPFRVLYTFMSENSNKASFRKLISWSRMEHLLMVGKDHLFASDEERFVKNEALTGDNSSQDRNDIEVARRWWGGEGISLLRWWQRDYLTELYGEFQPAFGGDEDLPYDIDHLIPRAEWGYHWTNEKTGLVAEIDDEKIRKKFQYSRNVLGDSVGNKALLDRTTNRGKGSASLAAKMAVLEKNNSDCARLIRASVEGYMEIGATRENGHDGKPDNNWKLPRLKHFQLGIQERAARLYERFYTELKLDEWETP